MQLFCDPSFSLNTWAQQGTASKGVVSNGVLTVTGTEYYRFFKYSVSPGDSINVTITAKANSAGAIISLDYGTVGNIWDRVYAAVSPSYNTYSMQYTHPLSAAEPIDVFLRVGNDYQATSTSVSQFLLPQVELQSPSNASFMRTLATGHVIVGTGNTGGATLHAGYFSYNIAAVSATASAVTVVLNSKLPQYYSLSNSTRVPVVIITPTNNSTPYIWTVGPVAPVSSSDARLQFTVQAFDPATGVAIDMAAMNPNGRFSFLILEP